MDLFGKVEHYAVDIVRKLQNAGFEAYIVGGAVRDFLLDRVPKDYDISTSATPEEVRDTFGRRRARIIGRRFKLVHLRVGREIVEISTFRRAPEDHQKRKPRKLTDVPDKMIFHDNEYGTCEEDAYRRDFTVNALFYDPVHNEIKDFTGQGLSDIKDGIVRVIGKPKVRFEEDPVRLIRALKLVGMYDFKLEAQTEKFLESGMSLIDHAAPPRLSLEIEKVLLHLNSAKMFKAFFKFGLLQHYVPFLHKNWNTPQGQAMLDMLEVYNQRVEMGKYRTSISLAIALVALPFIEKELGAQEPGQHWDSFDSVHFHIRGVIERVFAPLTFCRLIIDSAVRVLMLQHNIMSTGNKELMNERSYEHARELLVIQNIVLWKIKSFEKKWPSGSERGKSLHKATKKGFYSKRRKRRRGPDDRGRGSKGDSSS